MPGGGGAPEIATSCGQVFVTMRHTRQGLVENVDFMTSLGFGKGGGARRRLGIETRGPTQVITDLCILRPDVKTHELTVTSMHPGVEADDVRRETGWPIRFAADVSTTPAPTEPELAALRELYRRTEQAQRASQVS